ncbi:MAG: hypothetical protein GEV07_00715 [Streptosporangiales bacterium]|nr:hypothetical protein [Streptosporangiales bacterium]
MPIAKPSRRAAAQAREQYAADQQLADQFDELLDAADDALDRLRRATATSRDARLAAERGLLDAIRSAEAAERATAGLHTYGDRIAFRKARAKPEVDAWGRRLLDLRTRREALKLRNQSTPGTLVPRAVQVQSTEAYGPHVFGLEALPGTLRAGVNLKQAVDR